MALLCSCCGGPMVVTRRFTNPRTQRCHFRRPPAPPYAWCKAGCKRRRAKGA